MPRPKSSNPKLAVSLRLDADLVDAMRADGEGWQTRANAALRRAFLPAEAAVVKPEPVRVKSPAAAPPPKTETVGLSFGPVARAPGSMLKKR